MLKEESFIQKYDLINTSTLNSYVLEGIADWVRVVDQKGIIIYANKAMKKALGEDIVGMRCNEAHCQMERCEFCITERSIDTGRVYQKEEYINGNYYSIKSSPVRNEKKEIFAAVEVFRNVTRERKLELELINKNKKMSKDLRFSRKIQEKMLPDRGSKEGVLLDYIYKSSEMLSGDMFDIFSIDDDNVGVYISDVAGNGVSASLMTMFVRQTMRVMGNELLSPSMTLRELNRRFQDLNLEAENYFTIFYGIYNKKNKTFLYSNGGHNCAPIRYNDDEIETLELSGFPINSFILDVSYEERQVKLKTGDKILLFTDGVTESRNSVGIEFGLDGVLDIVEDRPDNILKVLDNEIMNHSWAQQDDDLAIVLLTIK